MEPLTTDTVSIDPAALAARLQDPNRCIRMAALAELQMAGQEALPAQEAVAACMDDPNHDADARRLAVEVLASLGPPAVPALLHALDENQPTSVRVAAASVLARNGPAAEPAVDSLCRVPASG